MATDVHDYQRRLENVIRAIRQDQRISEHNKELILRYQRDLIARGLGFAKIVRKLYDLKGVCVRWLPNGKDLDGVSIDDIKEIVAQIETSKYAENTKRDLKITLRGFYTWLRGGKDPPEEVAWFKTSAKQNSTKLPEDMLAEEEIEKLIRAAPHARQRAFISVLYESGCRIGELLALRLKNIAFDEHGAKLLVHGKTGYRRVRIIAAVPYLVEWLNNHPKNDPEAYVWAGRSDGERVGYNAIRNMLINTAKRAGIKKKVNPHNFRHSRATALARHLTEAQMKEYLGWVQGSEMAAVYVHLSGRDVDGALLKLYGMKADVEQNGTLIKPKICIRCQNVNGFASQLCKRCGYPLQQEEKLVAEHIERSSSDALLDQMLNDPEFRQIFLKKAKSIMDEWRFSV